MLKSICGLLLVLVLGAASSVMPPVSAQFVSPEAQNLRQRLIGTWRFVKYFNVDVSGNVMYPFGEKPNGFVVWDNTGHVFAQVARPPDLKPLFRGAI